MLPNTESPKVLKRRKESKLRDPNKQHKLIIDIVNCLEYNKVVKPYILIQDRSNAYQRVTNSSNIHTIHITIGNTHIYSSSSIHT